VRDARTAHHIATHNGLWRTPAGQTKAPRVGDLQHDLMGFTVVGPNRFLASGHGRRHPDGPAVVDRHRPHVAALRRGLTGLLAWPNADALYLVAADGAVWRSTDGGREFTRVGSVGAEAEAVAANGPRELYAAVHGGTVLVSTDGGAHWQIRSTP
jgi:photosystem II stability/assembly factor-like uncharacterized protein